MNQKVKTILEEIKGTCDFHYVEFNDINSTNSFGDNALHSVAVWGDCEKARILIEGGIDINQHGEDGYTPLHNAVSHGHKDLVRLLLNSGANPYARTLGDQAFTFAKLIGEDDISNIISDFIENNNLANSNSAWSEHMKHIESGIEVLKIKIDKSCK